MFRKTMEITWEYYIEPSPKLISCWNYKFRIIFSFREIDDVLWESIEHHLPPQKLHIGRTRSDLSKIMKGILYVVTTGCTWPDVPSQYDSKSTVHRFLLYPCEYSTYQEIFNELLNKGYDLKKIDLLSILLISWFQNPDYSCFWPKTGNPFHPIDSDSLLQNIVQRD
jgi:putative transposase